MIRSDANRFGRPLYILYPGDYFATGDDCLMATVTGSCAVVCLHDAVRRMGGVGHFIVPGGLGTEGIIADEVARQGITSLEQLIGEIVKLGGDRKRLRATLFGAGSFGVQDSVAGGNIRFLHEYFRFEGIPVNREDLGGDLRRKIFFDPRTGESYRKYLKNNRDHSEFMKLESEYVSSVFRNKETYGTIMLFD
jgi:chemotaxis protein CheD